MECTNPTQGFFCGLSPTALQLLNEVSHKSTLQAGAILFVEGQSPRGTFILCSGRVNLSTTSREGKVLILKTAEAGEARPERDRFRRRLESTAETSSPCQLSFVDRDHLLELMQSHTEVGRTPRSASSRDYQSAYRDVHTHLHLQIALRSAVVRARARPRSCERVGHRAARGRLLREEPRHATAHHTLVQNK